MQPGFFDLDNRYQQLEKLGDPLPTVERVVDWEAFRPMLEQVHHKKRKSHAGRKPYDVVLMFKVLVLQHLYNLADEQTEYPIRDRYSFCRFPGLTPEGRVPDARTLWLFRERLKERDLVETLFVELSKQMEASGYTARRGQIVDASLVAAPRQRNRREENALVKQGETPKEWKDTPAKLRQKDVEARWTKKHGKTYYGYKNHVSIDNEHKLVRRFEVTDASVHDSQVLDSLLDPTNTSADVWADSAYRSKEREATLKERGYRSHIQTKGTARRPLSKRSIKANHRRAKVRVRIEHIFAAQTAMGGMLVRTIGLARARVKIGMMNIAYNIRRMAYLETRCALSSP